MPLSQAEIDLINKARAGHVSRREEFMEMAEEVCAMFEVKFPQICGVTRGDDNVCRAREVICRIAADRGFHVAVIGRFIRRDRTSVVHALRKTAPQPKCQ